MAASLNTKKHRIKTLTDRHILSLSHTTIQANRLLHGLVVLELQFSRHFLIVLSSMSSPIHCTVRHSHQSTSSGCPLDLHLHDSDTLANSRRFALKRENSSMVIIVDRDGSCVGFAEDRDGGWCSSFQSNRMSIGPPYYAGVAQADVEILIFLKDVIVDNADGHLFEVFAGFEDQCALSKFVVRTGVGCAIFCAVVNLGVNVGKDQRLRKCL